MPVAFNQNEWFIILSILLFVLLAISLPKRLSGIETVLFLLFNCALSKTTDYFIAAAFPLDLYDYNDTYKLDFFDEWLQFGLYPIVGFMLIYWYDVWLAYGFNRVVFVLLSAGLSVLYEWLSVEGLVFTYKGWHLYYSAIAYVILISMNLLLYHRIKKWSAEVSEK